MTHRSGWTGVSAALCSAAVLCAAGCGAAPSAELAPPPGAACIASAEPSLAPDAAGALPGLIQTLYANGIVWVGSNGSTAESGVLSMFDSGFGTTVGLAFGDGQNVKRFLEVVYTKSENHEVINAVSGAVDASARHERVHVGTRRYIFPVAGRKGRIAPFISGGLAWHELSSNSAVTVNQSNGQPASVTDATGMGIYAGTGLELYFGEQASLSLDVRGSYWNWEGQPEGTGDGGTLGTSLSLVYHF
jgi:hypothetical protein